MKTNRLRNVAIGLLSFLAFVILSTIFTPAVAGMVIATGGVAVAGGISEQGVRENVPGLNMEDVSKTVTWMNPSKTPLDTILRQIREAEKMNAMITRYYSVASKALYDLPSSEVSDDGTTAAKPCKAYTYSTGNGLTSIYVAVSNSAIWSEKDTCLMRGLTLNVGSDGKPVVGTSTGTIESDVAFLVTSKSGSVLRLTPLNGTKGLNTNAEKFVVPDFAATTKLYRMGKAMHEKDASTTAFGIIPEPEEQYAQYFMAQVEESVFQRMTQQEVKFDFHDYERQNIYDMRGTTEMSYLFGAKGYTLNPDNTNQKIYTTDGITRKITKALTYGTGSGNKTVSYANVIDWCKSTFVGNSGSDERYLWAGADLLGALHSVETIQKQVNGKAPVVKWGIKFTEIVTNFGMLYINHHPLLTATGWGDNGIILDLEHVRKKEFLPMGVRQLDLKTPGTSLVDATVLSEASCLTLAYPDCHAIIKVKA